MVAEYDYCDPAGNVRYQVVRKAPKFFVQRRPDGKGGWVWNMEGVEPLPYRLPELLAAPDKSVFISEGEKDAIGWRKRGSSRPATTAAPASGETGLTAGSMIGTW